MAKPDHSDNDGVDHVHDEDNRLHRVQARLVPGRNAARNDGTDGCEGVYDNSSDKNGEELLTDIKNLIHVSIIRHLNWVINVRLSEALNLIT